MSFLTLIFRLCQYFFVILQIDKGKDIFNNLNPKSLTGTKAMKKNFTSEFNELEKRIRIEMCRRIESKLWERYMMMYGVIERGFPILEKANDERFDNLYDKRQEVHKKMQTLAQIAGMINRMSDEL